MRIELKLAHEATGENLDVHDWEISNGVLKFQHTRGGPAVYVKDWASFRELDEPQPAHHQRGH